MQENVLRAHQYASYILNIYTNDLNKFIIKAFNTRLKSKHLQQNIQGKG